MTPKFILLCCTLLTLSWGGFAQKISGNLSLLKGETIYLEGFDGFSTYLISSAVTDPRGNFSMPYSEKDFGVGYLISADEKAFFVILNGEDVSIVGEALGFPETVKITQGRENQLFEQYALEQPRREQALSAWMYLEKLYVSDSMFIQQSAPLKAIQTEKQRIKNEDATFLANLPKDSYVHWFLPMRKLISSVPVVAQYRIEEIPATIQAFRTIDYADNRLYKSGLLRDALEGHFWLIENSGKPLDCVFSEMKRSIDAMMITLVKDEKKFNEITHFLFELFEKHSLFEASEYLALKVLNEVACTIDSDLAKQLESYRTMKKGNIAPEIVFGKMSYLNGIPQNKIQHLADIDAQYTLVLFGASWCPRCNDELPKIIQQYAYWQKMGVELVFVSLDTEPQIFEQYIKVIPFLTYCDFQKWDGQVVQDYYVFGTPSMFLLNSKREIVLRPNTVEQMDAWVDWVLVQGNK